MNLIKVVIVDDDPLYAWEVEQMLVEQNGFEVMGIFHDAPTAIAFINNTPSITVIVVDIHLKGEMTGIELVKHIQPPNLPVVFITQDKTDELYDKAKENGNFSYLVKPFHKFTLGSVIYLLLSTQPLHDEESEKLLSVRIGNKREIIDPVAILWIESSRNHCTLHTATKSYIIRKSLRGVMELLPPNEFMCIHKSFVVQLSEVRRIELKEKSVFVRDIPLPLGRNYIKDVRSKFTNLG